MNKLFRFFGRLVKAAVIVGVTLVVGLIVFLSCFEHEVPEAVLSYLSDRLSGEQYVIAIGRITFRFPRGVTIRDFRVLDRKAEGIHPFLAAERTDIRLSFSRLPWSTRNILKEVVITGLSFPRLPQGYYIPDSIEFPGSPDFKETHTRLEMTLPELSPFTVRLIRPDILAVRATEVQIPRVRTTAQLLKAEGIHIIWPDTDVKMALDGEATMDIAKQRIDGIVQGQARQNNIRPMLAALEITNSYQFIDAFTGVTAPVDASCKFDVDLMTGDLHLLLGLHPINGAYRGVPFKSARGNVDVRVFVRDTFQNAHITVGPLIADLKDGRRLGGSVFYENTNDVGFVTFDARTTSSLSNALAIANTMNDGTLDCLELADPGEISIQGLLAVDPFYAATNNLRGTFAFNRGKLFGIPLSDAFSRWALKGTDVYFDSARAESEHGGKITGSAHLSVPEFKQEHARFNVRLAADRLPLPDLAAIFDIPLDGRSGLLRGTLDLSGPLDGENIVPRLTGAGHVDCTEGNLAKIALFSGFFTVIGKLPGLKKAMNIADNSTSVAMSSLTMDYGITNGVFNVSKFAVQGESFTIEGSGKYDMVQDAFDVKVLLRLNHDTFIGTLTRPLSWTLPNFLEFRVYGPLAKPEWRYTGPAWRTILGNRN